MFDNPLLALFQVDPFLCLVGDSKLQAVNKNSAIVFGSEEDDLSASRFLSEITITDDQTRESFASEIVKSLEKIKDVSKFKEIKVFTLYSRVVTFISVMQAEICTIREQLLSEFLPDDVCPLGAQLFETPAKIYELDSRMSVSHHRVTAI